MQYEELMDFGLTGEQRMVRKAARSFTEKEILPFIGHYEKEGRFPRDIVEKVAQLGYLGVIVPEEYGGASMDIVSYGVICEEIARADWVTASVISVQNSLVESSILNFGTEEQKQRLLVPLAQGKKTGCRRYNRARRRLRSGQHDEHCQAGGGLLRFKRIQGVHISCQPRRRDLGFCQHQPRKGRAIMGGMYNIPILDKEVRLYE